MQFEEIIGSEADSRGCYRPCEVATTPGRFSIGFGTRFDDDADMDVVKQDFIAKADAYYLPLLAKAEADIAEGRVEWQNDAEVYKKRIQEARDNEIPRYDAYESVKIHFMTKPSPEIIEFMKQRAEGFAAPLISIVGFRLGESVTTTTFVAI